MKEEKKYNPSDLKEDFYFGGNVKPMRLENVGVPGRGKGVFIPIPKGTEVSPDYLDRLKSDVRRSDEENKLQRLREKQRAVPLTDIGRRK